MIAVLLLVVASSISGPAAAEVTIRDAERFLRRQGYLFPPNITLPPTNETEAFIQRHGGRQRREIDASTIRRYQGVNNLPTTGQLDNLTLLHTRALSCGTPDPPDDQEPLSFRYGGTSYKFFPETFMPRLPHKSSLTWTISQYGELGTAVTAQMVDEAVRKAFKMWSDVCNLNFRQTSGSADIDIMFASQASHGCNWDGGVFESSTLAHVVPWASNPHKIHMNDQREFTTDSSDMDPAYLTGVMAHEIGHILGIMHSPDMSNLMYRAYRRNHNSLGSDDIAAAKARYGHRG